MAAPIDPQRAAGLAQRQANVVARPQSAVAEHNLASLLGDMGRVIEAEAAARRAFQKGGDAPETWLVLARALLGQGLHEEAGVAYREALRRRPDYVAVVQELAQLIWMQTADAEAALEPIELALAIAPLAADLHVVKAIVREYVGHAERDIWHDLTRHGPRDVPTLEKRAAHLALAFDKNLALGHAQRAVAALPSDVSARLELARVHLARNEARAARDLIEPVMAENTDDQHARALLATAARLDGGSGATDYTRLVRSYVIDTPRGWPDLSAYLADLANALLGLHGLRTHPIGQSLRHGTQTTIDLSAVDDLIIQAFFTAIDGPIQEHLRHLGLPKDHRLVGCWSVRLSPGGHHASHIHSRGRLSSACHIALPPTVCEQGRQGWIGFGQPPFDCGHPLPPEHYERPEAGRLLLFPSWLWHSTVPFEGEGHRLTIAFDVVPT